MSTATLEQVDLEQMLDVPLLCETPRLRPGAHPPAEAHWVQVHGTPCRILLCTNCRDRDVQVVAMIDKAQHEGHHCGLICEGCGDRPRPAEVRYLPL